MEFAICTVAAAPVRSEPAHRSEMVNQLLFGETVEILAAKEEWFKIRSSYDGYEGWLTYHLISETDEATALEPGSYFARGLVNAITLPDQLINAPMGSQLTGFDPETRLLWDEQLKYHGSYRDISKPFDKELIKELVHVWMNAPYLWGGKTLMGVDCSGFVQTVFKVLGIKLQRDASQQAAQGKAVEQLSESRPGDLAFFHNPAGKVVHVGIIMEGGKIAHASGKVRLDHLDEKGINNVETNQRTHTFHSIRRFF